MKTTIQTSFGEVELHLYHRRERVLRLARRLGTTVSILDGACAQTNGFENGPEVICFVLLSADVRDPDQLAGLMAHEAVHAARFVLDHFGEDDPGEETVAYTVQDITCELLRMHRRWASEHPVA